MIHWDVNNEILTGNWYETNTENTEFTQGVFHELHRMHPDARLFLNEHSVISSGYLLSVSTYSVLLYRAVMV